MSKKDFGNIFRKSQKIFYISTGSSSHKGSYSSLYTPFMHRFKSSDWLKKGHMTWISFHNVHVRKLIHVCQFFTISLTLGESVTAAVFGTFTVRYGLQNLRMGCIKQTLTALLFGEW